MADIPLYEGDTISVHWGQMTHECQVWRSDELCHRCGGATIQLDPPWETWKLLCCAECALTTTHVPFMEALDNLQPAAIGLVSSIPVQVYNRLEIHNHRSGQFFTPYPVCLAMAKMLVHDAKHLVKEQEFSRAQEPCVGSGAMVIALA